MKAVAHFDISLIWHFISLFGQFSCCFHRPSPKGETHFCSYSNQVLNSIRTIYCWTKKKIIKNKNIWLVWRNPNCKRLGESAHVTRSTGGINKRFAQQNMLLAKNWFWVYYFSPEHHSSCECLFFSSMKSDISTKMKRLIRFIWKIMNVENCSLCVNNSNIRQTFMSTMISHSIERKISHRIDKRKFINIYKNGERKKREPHICFEQWKKPRKSRSDRFTTDDGRNSSGIWYIVCRMQWAAVSRSYCIHVHCAVLMGKRGGGGPVGKCARETNISIYLCVHSQFSVSRSAFGNGNYNLTQQ